jgi:hypothetical protein
MNFIVKYMRVSLFRHGPKNNDPQAHQTGVEAQLDPYKIFQIREHAREFISSSQGHSSFVIETTPIDRSISTGYVTHEEVRGKIDMVEPSINELIGSSAIHPENDNAINLGSRAMSDIWSKAKKQDDYGGQQGEHHPLYAWFEQGLDNPQARLISDHSSGNPDDPGISIREIGLRISTYFYEKLTTEDDNPHVVAYGHSGDIEPWLALTLAMMDENDDGRRTLRDYNLLDYFDSIGGAMEPLASVSLVRDKTKALFLEGTPLQRRGENGRVSIGQEIFQEQARIFRSDGVSNQVLADRLKLEG